MTNIADNVIALQAAVAALPQVIAEAVKAAGITATVDLTPVETKLDAISTKLDTVVGDVTPTPAAS